MDRKQPVSSFRIGNRQYIRHLVYLTRRVEVLVHLTSDIFEIRESVYILERKHD